jgi:hypothetical protein
MKGELFFHFSVMEKPVANITGLVLASAVVAATAVYASRNLLSRAVLGEKQEKSENEIKQVDEPLKEKEISPTRPPRISLGGLDEDLMFFSILKQYGGRRRSVVNGNLGLRCDSDE